MKNPFNRTKNKHIKRSVDALTGEIAALKAQIAKMSGEPVVAPSLELNDALHKSIVNNWNAVTATWPMGRTPSVEIVPDRDTPVPARENIARIQGKAVEEIESLDEPFIAGGLEDIRVVINIAEVFGLELTPETTVLDWGVGCGRIARHAPAVLKPNFHGADVDPVNVEWCKENMKFGEYVVLDPYKASPYEDDKFDLIYSHSVLTHLAEPDQDHWLAELGRITRGMMVLSVHGPYSASRMEWSGNPHAVLNYMVSGFVNGAVPNPDIADVTDPEYYRDVGHTPEYIRDHWSQFVDVVEIIPRGFGHWHDAVICRPKT